MTGGGIAALGGLVQGVSRRYLVAYAIFIVSIIIAYAVAASILGRQPFDQIEDHINGPGPLGGFGGGGARESPLGESCVLTW